MSRTFLMLLLLACPATSAADDYQQARARLVSAYQAQDYAAMRKAARDALAARPSHAGARFNLALAQALDGDAAASLYNLHLLADADVAFPVLEAEEFTALQQEFTWIDFTFKLERLRRPRGAATRLASFGPVDFIPEGILARDDGSLLLGSIRHGEILEWRDGETRRLSSPASGGHWSVFGMREDADGMVWFASAAIRQMQEVADTELGRSGLFRMDPDSGEIIDEMLLPDDGREQLLGDLVIDDEGLIYTSDSIGSAIYRYDPELRALDELVPPGRLVSPQGLVLLEGGRHLLVADYATGLYRVDTRNGQLMPVDKADGLVLQGIDGLYRDGDRLIVIQNGIRPHRVTQLQYDSDRNRIVDANILLANHPDFREPTLGQVHGVDFIFVANSQWDRFAADGSLDESDLVAPVLLRARLPER